MFKCVHSIAIFLALSVSGASSLSAGDATSSTVGNRQLARPAIGAASWAGAYLGIHAGYGWADLSIADGGTTITNPPYGAFSCGPALTGNYCNTPFDLSANGALGGVHIGFNWQKGNLVWGFEGEIGRIDASEEKTLFRPFDDRDFASVTFDWYATLTGKLGIASERALYYVKGGAAFARAEVAAADIDFNGANFAIYQGSFVRTDDLLRGWTIGIGWEYAFSRQLSLRAEYSYMDFGSITARSTDGDIYDFDTRLHTAKLGLSYRLQP